MYPPVLRHTANAWLALFELYLAPLRALAAPPAPDEQDYVEHQQEVWRTFLSHGPAARLDQPIFTDEVVARAKAH